MKANQSKMQFGSAGVGSGTHLPCVLLNMAMGVNVTHVPYRGEGPAQQDLIGGRIDYMCSTIQTGAALAQARHRQRHRRDVAASGQDHSRPADHRRAGPAGRRSERLERVLPAAAARRRPIVQKLNKAMSDTLDDPAVAQAA